MERRRAHRAFWWPYLRYFAIRGRRYWLTAALVLMSSIVLTPYISDILDLGSTKYWLYQHLTQLGTRAAKPRFVKVVLIGNDEYYHGDPHARIPLKRDYIARLVSALDKADAAVVALDFNLIIPNAETVKVGEYNVLEERRGESDVLMHTIADVATRRKIVLPKNVFPNEETGQYQHLPDLYEVYGLCTRLRGDGNWNHSVRPLHLTVDAQRNISCGYIQMPWDYRQIPLDVDVEEHGRITSFSVALARAIDPDQQGVGYQTLYASFIPEYRFIPDKTIFSAHKLLAGDRETLALLRHSAVIVGGGWDKLRIGSGEKIDEFKAPAGPIVGALMHENFTEAILDGRTYPPITSVVFELIFSIAAAIVLAGSSSILSKIVWFAALILGLVFLQWLVFFVFQIFFEAYLPLLGLALHSIIERLFEPRHHAR